MKERGNDQFQGDVTILFVEDDANDVLLVSRALSKCQLPAEAHFVHNPIELRDYLLGAGKFSDRTEYPVPEVIMTDYKFCGGSARDVLQWVQRLDQFKNIPVVV
ncbi:MAG: response regulator, partial [Limisphaerales bacterium]